LHARWGRADRMSREPSLTSQELLETVAYCGLVCGLCVHAAPEREGCAGCRNGGGSRDCHQRTCCTDKGLDGCWQCEVFPCDEGFFGDDAWRGLCIGSVRCVKKHGLPAYVDRLVSRLGRSLELGDYRHMSPDEVQGLLCGDSDPS